MVRSNFTLVRLSFDGATLEVEGVTEFDAGQPFSVDIIELKVAVARLPPEELLALDEPIPRDSQIFATLPGPIGESWTVQVPVEPGSFDSGNDVLIAGSTLSRRQAGESGGTLLEIDSWLGCARVRSSSEEKPAVAPDD